MAKLSGSSVAKGTAKGSGEDLKAKRGTLEKMFANLPSAVTQQVKKSAPSVSSNVGTPLKTAGKQNSRQNSKRNASTPSAVQQMNNQYKALADRLTADNQRDINEYQAEQQRLAEQQRAASNSQFDKQQNQNYINYMMSQKDLPGQLARLGITGGAAESSQIRANTNYENVKNNTESERNSAINNITNTLNNNLAQYRLSAASDLRNKLYANEQQRMAAVTKLKEQEKADRLAKKQRQYERYRDTIRRFDSITKVDKAIKNAKKSGKPAWQIQLLQAQRADLVAKAKEEAKSGSGKSGGSGGGGRSYRRSYRKSYGGGSSETSKSKEKEKSKSKGKRSKLDKGLEKGAGIGAGMGRYVRSFF